MRESSGRPELCPAARALVIPARAVAESLVVRVLGTAGGGGSTGAVNRGRLTDFHWILPPFSRRRTHGMGKS
jgi:hypothetical protein